jgi:uncharacterized protein
MDYETIQEIILEQKNEMEEKFQTERIIKRQGMERSKKFLVHPNIFAVLGVRRCGKSVFSWLLFKDKKFGYINFDDERLYGMEAKDLNKILHAFYELYGSDLKHIILDEIQNVRGWELFANRLRRTKKVIITGSNSKLLSSELSTHLTGRHIDITMYPFSFKEFLLYSDFELKDVYVTKERAEITKMLKNYISLGGFPERERYGKEILRTIYDDIVTKDVVFRHKIKKVDEIRKVAKSLITNFSCEFTYRSLKNATGINRVGTVSDWVGFLESAYLVAKIDRFSFKLKEQVLAPKKIYAVDTGIINVVGFKTSGNLGRLMENIVAIELLRRKSYQYSTLEIYYYKDHQQREVDFVIKEGTNIRQLIQVCYQIEDFNTRERELKSLIKAGKELKCNNLLVITWDYEAEEETAWIGTKRKITFLPLWKWLLVD